MLWLTLLAPPSVAHVARKSNKPGLSDWRHVIQSFMWLIRKQARLRPGSDCICRAALNHDCEGTEPVSIHWPHVRWSLMSRSGVVGFPQQPWYPSPIQVLAAVEADVAGLADDVLGFLESDAHEHGAQHSCRHRGSGDS